MKPLILLFASFLYCHSATLPTPIAVEISGNLANKLQAQRNKVQDDLYEYRSLLIQAEQEAANKISPLSFPQCPQWGHSVNFNMFYVVPLEIETYYFTCKEPTLIMDSSEFIDFGLNLNK